VDLLQDLAANEIEYTNPGRMADETPEPRSSRMADPPHHWTIGLSIAALVFSLTSTAVSMYSVHFGGLQYKLAESVRDDAKKAAQLQARDLERTRKAAEDSAMGSQRSAEAAEKLVEGMNRSARAAESSTKAGEESVSISRRALLLSVVGTFLHPTTKVHARQDLRAVIRRRRYAPVKHSPNRPIRYRPHFLNLTWEMLDSVPKFVDSAIDFG
jgi:hypothetical protein